MLHQVDYVIQLYQVNYEIQDKSDEPGNERHQVDYILQTISGELYKASNASYFKWIM